MLVTRSVAGGGGRGAIVRSCARDSMPAIGLGARVVPAIGLGVVPAIGLGSACDRTWLGSEGTKAAECCACESDVKL